MATQAAVSVTNGAHPTLTNNANVITEANVLQPAPQIEGGATPALPHGIADGQTVSGENTVTHKQGDSVKAKKPKTGQQSTPSVPGDLYLRFRYLSTRPSFERIPSIVCKIANTMRLMLPRQVRFDDFKAMLLSATLSNLYHRVQEANGKVQNVSYPMEVVTYYHLPLLLAKVCSAYLPIGDGISEPKVLCDLAYLRTQIAIICGQLNIPDPLVDPVNLLNWQVLHPELSKKITRDVFTADCRGESLLRTGVLILERQNDAEGGRIGPDQDAVDIPRTVVSAVPLSRSGELLCAVLQPREYREMGLGSWYAPILDRGEQDAFGVTVTFTVAGRELSWVDVQKEILTPQYR